MDTSLSTALHICLARLRADGNHAFGWACSHHFCMTNISHLRAAIGRRRNTWRLARAERQGVSRQQSPRAGSARAVTGARIRLVAELTSASAGRGCVGAQHGAAHVPRDHSRLCRPAQAAEPAVRGHGAPPRCPCELVAAAAARCASEVQIRRCTWTRRHSRVPACTGHVRALRVFSHSKLHANGPRTMCTHNAQRTDVSKFCAGRPGAQHL